MQTIIYFVSPRFADVTYLFNLSLNKFSRTSSPGCIVTVYVIILKLRLAY